MSGISFIVPTIGRASLTTALASISPLDPDDEILVIGTPTPLLADAPAAPSRTTREGVTALHPPVPDPAGDGWTRLAHSAVRTRVCARGDDWGCTERTLGIAAARGRHLAFLDDDDAYLPGTLAIMRRALALNPDRPILFRMLYPNGGVLWADPALRVGNVSTQMILMPNDPALLGRWSPRREGDFDFLASMGWAPEAIVWRSEIIARLGHVDGV